MIQVLERLKRMVLGVGVVLFTTTASAGLGGHYIKAAHIYDPAGEIGSFEGQLVSELGGPLFQGEYNATVTNEAISIVWVQGKTLLGQYGFNGFVLTILDGSPITSVSIAPSSTWQAFADNRLTFDGSHVRADFGSLTSLPTQRLDLVVTTAVPEAPTVVLLGLGLLMVTLKARQGDSPSRSRT